MTWSTPRFDHLPFDKVPLDLSTPDSMNTSLTPTVRIPSGSLSLGISHPPQGMAREGLPTSDLP